MPRTFCLLNHQLTRKQIEELETVFCSEEVICPDQELSAMWSQINPEDDREEVAGKRVAWLKTARKGDCLLVQGEFGTTFKLVDYALKNGLVPIYATTKRVAKEVRDGERIHREYIFEHVCFKKYEYFRNEMRVENGVDLYFV